MKPTLLAAIVLAACSGLSVAAQPAMSVYVAGELERVRPADAPRSLGAAALMSARNEYAPFQIIVRAGEAGLKGVNAVAAPLKPRRGQAIPASRIAFCREHYVEVKKLSPKSHGELGWYPDALIPFVDPSRRFRRVFPLRPSTSRPIPTSRSGWMCWYRLTPRRAPTRAP
jgi:hypothetical protein